MLEICWCWYVGKFLPLSIVQTWPEYFLWVTWHTFWIGIGNMRIGQDLVCQKVCGKFPDFDQIEDNYTIKHKLLIGKLLITKVSTCAKLSRLPLMVRKFLLATSQCSFLDLICTQKFHVIHLKIMFTLSKIVSVTSFFLP